MEADEVYIGAKVSYGGREGYVIDTFTDNKGKVIAVVSGAPSSTGIGNNVPLDKLFPVKGD